MIPIILLAAGRSSRMAPRDKLSEPVGGVPLLRRQAAMAATFGGDVHVALPRDDHPRAGLLEGLNVSVMVVPEAGEGMSGTLRGAVARLPGESDFMVLLGDLPLIEAGHVRSVLERRAEVPDAAIWRGATEDGKPGHPIIFAGRLRPEFASLGGDGGGEPLVKRHQAETELCPLPGQIARFDLDTPEDWARFRAETGL